MADVLKTRDLVIRNPRPTLAQIEAGGFAVSSVCDWEKDVWHLDSEQDGMEAYAFDFRKTAAEMVQTAKMWVWLSLGGIGPVAPMRVSSVAAIPERLSTGFGFLAECAPTIDLIVPAHFELFVDILKKSYPVDSDGVGPSEQPIRYQMSVWRDLWDQRDGFAAAGLPALSFDPFATTPFAEVLAGFACRDHDKRPSLPDDVAALLFVSSEAYLDWGQDVASLQTRVLNLMEEAGGVATIEVLNQVRRGPYRPSNGRPWHTVPDSVDTPAKAVLHLQWLIGLVEGAMAHLIHHELGLRPSEYVSPEGGYDEGSQLPRCVEAVPVPEQGLTLFLLHGTLFKMQEKPRPSVWAMGVTPIGANMPPPSVRAVELLDWLHAPWRGDSDKLQVRFSLHPDPSRRGRSSKAITVSKVRKRLRRFYDQIDWSVLELNEAEVAEIVADRGGKIVPTNMRKTFAGYFVRLDQRLLGPVSTQLKHDSVEETDVDYVMNDPAMLEPAREFASREVARIMLQQSGADAASAAAILPSTHLPHLANIARLRDECHERDLLDAVDRIVVERDLSRPRQPISQSVVPSREDRADALLEQYRVVRPTWLNAVQVGRRREYDSFRARSERIRSRLAELGIDPPTDEELGHDGVA